MGIVMTDHRVQVFYDNITALSRIHSKGVLWVPESVLATVSGYTERDVHSIMLDSANEGWVQRSKGVHPKWRIQDWIIETTKYLVECDACRVETDTEVRALANARLLATIEVNNGRRSNVCASHFASMECRVGQGLGQFLRMEY